MNKKTLVNKIAENSKYDTAKYLIADIVTCAFDEITAAVAEGEEVQITGFGTFKKTYKAARNVRNPQNGELMKTEAKYMPKFIPGQAFKEAVK